MSASTSLPSVASLPAPVCSLESIERHAGTNDVACLIGRFEPPSGWVIDEVGVRGPAGVWRCRYPFVHPATPDGAPRDGFVGLFPAGAVAGDELEFVVRGRSAAGQAHQAACIIAARNGLAPTARPIAALVPDEPWLAPEAAELETLLETRLFAHLARGRGLILRLDLINKCNLRCVMCHYSDEAIALRPAQRIAPETFIAWFESVAPLLQEVVLSCGDEPLMSPHFEEILRYLGSRHPEVRIRFCTNAMLLSERIADAIVAAKVHTVLFSFDGVTKATLERIRVGANYERVIRHIIGLKRRRAASGRPAPRFVFNFVMMASNVHEAPAFVTVARRLGADFIDFRHAVPPMEPNPVAAEMLERHPARYNRMERLIREEAGRLRMETYLPPPFAGVAPDPAETAPAVSLDDFTRTLTALGEDPALDTEPARPPDCAPFAVLDASTRMYCDRPFSEVMIQRQQEVYPCPWHREKLGTLDGSQSLADIFFGKNFRRLRLAMLDPAGDPGCAGCPVKVAWLPTRLLPPARN